MVLFKGKHLLWLLFAVICSGLIIAASSPPLTSSFSELSFSEGEWAGVMFAYGTGTADIASWDASWTGTMAFTSEDELLDGEFYLDGAADISTPDLEGSAVYIGSGLISGASTKIFLQLSEMTVTGTMVVAGQAVPFSEALGPGDFKDGISVILEAATCTMVTGDWATPIQKNLIEAGVSGSVFGHWAAYRIADLPGEDTETYRAEMAQLIEDAFEWRTLVYTSNLLHFYFLEPVLERAEELNRRLQRSTDCDFVDEKAFTTAIASILAEMFQFALDNAIDFTTGDLLRMASAGLRIGVLGSGASNPELALELEGRILDKASELLEIAKTVENKEAAVALVSEILATATLLGDDGLQEAATDAFIEIISGA